MNRQSKIERKIAESMGNSNLTGIVRDIIKISNEKKILYHGVKRRNEVGNVICEGVKPLTPHGKGCSYWSTGLSLFHPDMDSPFFCYSGRYCKENPDICELNMVIASYDILSERLKLPDYKKDSNILICDVVHQDCFSFISIKVKGPKKSSKKQYELANHILLEEIHKNITLKKFPAGKIIKRQEEITKIS